MEWFQERRIIIHCVKALKECGVDPSEFAEYPILELLFPNMRERSKWSGLRSSRLIATRCTFELSKKQK